MIRVYLDHNATSPLRPQARAKMLDALDVGGNASSVHAEGRAARAMVEAAREKVAALVGGRARNVVFTSGATEALNLALAPAWRGPAGAPERLILSATDHVAAQEGHRFGAAVAQAPVHPDGRLDMSALEAALAGGGRPMLALQAANNETGVLQEVVAAAEKVRAAGGLTVCDAVQAAGRVACTFETTGADVLIVSSHKIGGPMGVGALVVRDPAVLCDAPMIRGGGQERGVRAGTENVAAIAGFGAAAEIVAGAGEAARIQALRDEFETRLLVLAPDVTIYGAGAPRLPNTSAFSAPGVSADTMLIAFDLAGVALSSGSACSSGKVKRSHILAAMGVPENVAKGTLRVSFGWNSSPADVEACLATLERFLARNQRRQAAG
jgi:cysteine desulfurase